MYFATRVYIKVYSLLLYNYDIFKQYKPGNMLRIIKVINVSDDLCGKEKESDTYVTSV